MDVAWMEVRCKWLLFCGLILFSDYLHKHITIHFKYHFKNQVWNDQHSEIHQFKIGPKQVERKKVEKLAVSQVLL